IWTNCFKSRLWTIYMTLFGPNLQLDRHVNHHLQSSHIPLWQITQVRLMFQGVDKSVTFHHLHIKTSAVVGQGPLDHGPAHHTCQGPRSILFKLNPWSIYSS